MPSPLDGPLGPLPNMFWDPVRAKYFPNPRQSTAVPNQPRQERPDIRPPSPSKQPNRVIKGPRSDPGISDKQPEQGPSMDNQARQKFNAYRRLGGNGGLRLSTSALQRGDRMRGVEQNYWSNLKLQCIDDIEVQGSRISDIVEDQAKLGYIAIYNNGWMMGRASFIGNLTYIDEEDVSPWIKPRIIDSPRFLRGFELLYEEDFCYHDAGICNLGAIDGSRVPVVREDIIHSTFGSTIAFGYGRVIVKFDFVPERPTQTSLLAERDSSEMLCINHACPNIVYAGLRNSQIISGDFRESKRGLKPIASLNHKAVVKVKRLCDSVVPFGLLASGMGDKLVIFDVRFSKQPLKELSGHVNSFYSDLGLNTTPDGQFLFAGQSDKRVRAWSLVDGQRLLPDELEVTGPESNKLLSRVFDDRPTGLLARGEILHVGVGREVLHFGLGPGSHSSSIEVKRETPISSTLMW